jgi:hypothetical protein
MWDRELIPIVSQEKSLLTRTRSMQMYKTAHTRQIIKCWTLVKHHLSASADWRGISLHKQNSKLNADKKKGKKKKKKNVFYEKMWSVPIHMNLLKIAWNTW